MESAELALKWIAALGLTASVAAGAAYTAFQFLGKKWLDAHFAQRLQAFRHEQNQEIERLRYRINALMDRTTKLHQHEFEALPEVWSRLGVAFSATKDFTSRLVTYSDLESMGPAQSSEFLDASELPEWQKQELRGCKDTNRRYQEMIFWHRLQKVADFHAEFHNYFIAKGIFIQPELKEKIRDLSNMMYDAFNERALDHANPMLGQDRFAKGDLFQHEGPSKLEAIETDVQARLWHANKLD